MGSSVDWSAALMEQGFDGLSRMTSDPEDVRAARERYDDLRSHVDAVARGADRVEFVVAAIRVNRSGRHDEALVVVSDSMVIVSGRHRAVVGARSVTDIFPRPVLSVTAAMAGGRRAIELHADGRRTRLVLMSRSSTIEAALLSLGGRDRR
ncbi:hypothetical protein Back2_24210 [Nocardioides baekrokdamisoli]|uniref:Uncharacterized protein n=1 Tax=Nocardioides baekrokdamisoli TaxID=1804624 RepID=A0A3G9J3X6_9ACTN|nr:hypothetical protein Back2_24210 [Nocardioides baekrokdamisoli]